MKFENTDVHGFGAAIRGIRNSWNSWDKGDSIVENCLSDMDAYEFYSPDIADIAAAYIGNSVSVMDEDAYEEAIRETESKVMNSIMVEENFTLVGPKDLSLMKNLCKAGASDRKFLRYIDVSVDIVGPAYWLAEFDTYKIATTRNSTSLQHTGKRRDFSIDDFTIDDIELNNITIDNETFSNLDYDGSIEDLKTIIDIVNKWRYLAVETKDYKYFRVMRQLMPQGYNYRITWKANYEVIRNMYHQRKTHQLTEWSKEFCEWAESLPFANELIVN